MSSFDFEKFKAGISAYLPMDDLKIQAGELVTMFQGGAIEGAGPKLSAFFETVVIGVEKVKTDLHVIMDGAEKRKALVDFLDDCIRLNWFLDKIVDIDGRVLGMAIDLVVDQINKRIGHNWLEPKVPNA